MVVINEWLPNPRGADAEGEWVELVNLGTTTENLSGWAISASGGKKVSLSIVLNPGEYKVFRRVDTKLTLKNSGETLVLRDAQGKTVSVSAYKGSAFEGKSYARLPSGDFTFSVPTPGARNVFPEVAAGTPLSSGPLKSGTTLSVAEAALLAAATGVLCGTIILFAIFHDEKIHKLLFGGDPKIR